MQPQGLIHRCLKYFFALFRWLNYVITDRTHCAASSSWRYGSYDLCCLRPRHRPIKVAGNVTNLAVRGSCTARNCFVLLTPCRSICEGLNLK